MYIVYNTTRALSDTLVYKDRLVVKYIENSLYIITLNLCVYIYMKEEKEKTRQQRENVSNR